MRLTVDPDERRALSARARFGRKQPVRGSSAMAVSSHPVVSRVAADVMRDGGTAVDAFLAASVAQTVVEPHMSTITGVLGFLRHDGLTGEQLYLNGSVAAPAEPITGFRDADVVTGRAVAVPGFWAAWEAAYERFGSLPRERLLAPAVGLAREGIDVTPFLYGYLFERAPALGRYPEGREIFFPGGALAEPGHVVRQPRLAGVLERLAADGGDYFYRGEFAERLVRRVAAAGGVLTRADLEAYEARWQQPVRTRYRDVEVVGSPPPDHGGLHVLEMLRMLDEVDITALGHPTESAESLELLVRVHAEVYAAGARQRDPAHHPLPVELLLSREYAQTRLALLSMAAPVPAATVSPGSNHITIVDPAGTIVTGLHSCMSTPWTNGIFVDGVSVCAAGTHYLRVQPGPGERISSIVAPTIVLRGDRPLLALGSPSTSLLAAILQTVVDVVDFGHDIEASVLHPRFGGPTNSLGERPIVTTIEADLDESVRDAVASRGVALQPVEPWAHTCGSIEAIALEPSGDLYACPDPRRTSGAEGW